MKEIEYVTVIDTVDVSDTTEVYIHDTTEIIRVKVDSVDRYVEKITYVDSNGVVHEKEINTLTHYITVMDEQYKVKEAEYKSKIEKLEKQLNDSEKTETEYIEKPLRWWQKGLIWSGVVSILALLLIALWKFSGWFYSRK